MKKIKTGKKIAISGLLFAILILGVFAFYNVTIPKTVSCFVNEDIPSYLGATFEEDLFATSTSGEMHGQYKIFGAIPVKSVKVSRIEDVRVYVGGVPFGIKFMTEGVSVVGFEDEATNPAYKAGLRLYDTIIKINGKKISGNADVSEAVSGGGEINITFLRAGKEMSIKFKPQYSENEKKYTMVYLPNSVKTTYITK